MFYIAKHLTYGSNKKNVFLYFINIIEVINIQLKWLLGEHCNFGYVNIRRTNNNKQFSSNNVYSLKREKPVKCNYRSI